MIKVRAFIFDTDQTLLNTLKRFYVVFNRNLEKLGLKPLEYRDFVKKYSQDILDEVVAPLRSKKREALELNYLRVTNGKLQMMCMS